MTISIQKINQLRYNIKFQQLCFLIKRKYSLKRKMSIDEFWAERYKHYFEWGIIPQEKSWIEYDLLRLCKACELENSLDNYVLIYVCAIYGVTRTTKYALIIEKIDGHQTKEDIKNNTIKYLYHKVIKARIPVDNYVSIYIEELFQDKDDFFIEQPQELEEIKKLEQLEKELPLQIANMEISLENEKNTSEEKIPRNKELKRNYFFYKWRRQGMKLKEIAQKWDCLNKEIVEITNEDIVAKGIKAYEIKFKPFSDNPFYLYNNLLNYFEKTKASERTFEFITRNVNVDKKAI
ncbi:hypothetical protein [Priestia megaterium]|uniref:hypothetical protein n=1 Tax=Priestia megaterium TaxID=1404 RepID=UPI00398FB81E